MYTVGKVVNTIDELLDLNSEVELKKKKGNPKLNKPDINYINLPATFDIETSSFYENGKKRNIMYIWQFCLNGTAIYGRTWEEWDRCLAKITKFYGLDTDRRLIIFVRNLSYEMQYLRKRYGWFSIFAREERRPMYACTDFGVEFRCSYMLAGCSLEVTGKNLTKYKMEKKVGDLDYDLVRTYKTPLTEKELDYCLYDVFVDNAYIQEEIEAHDNDITKIELTNTGKVRTYVRNKLYNKQNYCKTRSSMKNMTINDTSEYDMLKRLFTGGFTHANYHNANKIHKDVTSFDFTSSYPTVLIAEMYPSSKGEIVEVNSLDEIKEMAKSYCLMFNIEFNEIVSKIDFEHFISVSKCFNVEEPVVDNGRLISAKKIRMTINEVDFSVIDKTYNWDSVVIGKCYRYHKSYLSKPMIECILDFYEDKTTLKDVEGMEREYQLKKGMLNSLFGMQCTDIISDEITYANNVWGSLLPDVDKMIDDYNNNTKRITFYPQGCWCTSYARRNLWYGILECKNDYIYADTDSIKILNADKHMEFINKYNNWITNKLKKCLECNKINVDRICPKTVKGEEKPLGVWDNDGIYKTFKTLGAKRYLVEKLDGHIVPTIAGVNKKKTGEYLSSLENPFDYFTDKMNIDKEHSGRLTSTYIDEEQSGVVVDYLGVECEYHELASIHMEKSEFNLTMSPVYLALLNGTEDYII